MKSYTKIKGIKNFTHPQKLHGVDLSGLCTILRGNHESTGISTETFGGVWFETPKGLGIFKTYDSYDYNSIRNIRIINELVSMHLLQQAGIPCASYEPASYQVPYSARELHAGNVLMLEELPTKRYDGLVSYNILKNNEKLVPLSEFIGGKSYDNLSLTEISKILDIRQREGYKLSKRKLITSFYALSLMDQITKQTDRKANNVNVAIDQNNNVRFAECIDSEFAFFGRYFTSDKLYSDEHSLEEIISDYNLKAKMLTVSPPNNIKERSIDNARNLTNYAKANPELEQIFKHVIKSIDIDQAIKDTEASGVSIPEEYKNFMKIVINHSISTLSNLYRMKSSSKTLEDLEKLY